MKLLKWGFIGCGEVVELKSGPAFSEVEGSQVVAVMSRTEQHARMYAIKHGVPRWYTDAQENPPTKAGDIRDSGSIPGPGRSPGERNGNSLQYSCLENAMDRGAWQL